MAHRSLWAEYREGVVACYLADEYEQSIDGPVDAEVCSHFAGDIDEMDAAILIAKHRGLKLIEDTNGWLSPLQRRVIEMERDD